MDRNTDEQQDLVKIIAEPVPYSRDHYQLFINAIVTNAEGKKLYIPHILVDIGETTYYETSEMEGLYGCFPVAFEAYVENGIDWEYGEFRQNHVYLVYAGDDFSEEVEPFEDPDDDTAYLRDWNTWLVNDRCHYYPVLEA